MMLVIQYLKKRFSPVKFILLSTLLCLFVYDVAASGTNWAKGIFFLFISLFTFRILDDAGSVYYDRANYPERTYLKKENYPSFLRFTITICLGYLLSLFFYSQAYFLVIAGLMGVSVMGYVFFGKNNFILPIVPLFKYPILLWCLMSFSSETNDLLVALSSLLIIASHDVIELIGKKDWAHNFGLIILLMVGFMLFPFWTNKLYLICILILPLIIYLIRKWKYRAFVPVLYYPIVYFVLTNFS
jgi:hypothetical protein